LPPAVEAAVRATLGNAYVAAGMESKGKPHLERVVELSAQGDNPLLKLRAKTGLVRVLLTEADYAKALALADEVERELESGATLEREALTELRFNLALRRAQIHAQRGEFEPALRSCEAALAAARGTQPPDIAAQVAALAALGQIAVKAAQTARAESVLREALALHASTQRPDTSSVAAIRHELGGVLLTLGRDEEAQRELEAALDLRRRLYGPRHTATGESLGQLGRAHSERRQYALALPMLEEALAIALEQMPRTHPNVATAMSRLADCKRASRDREGALPLYREALEIRRAVYGEVHPVVARSHGNLGLCLQELKQYEEAEQQLRTAIEQRRGMAGEEAALATNLQTLGLVREARGFPAERLELDREALALLRAALPASADTLAWALSRHAAHLQERGRPAESIPLTEEALRVREQLHGPDHPRTGRALSDLGSAFVFNREFARGIEVLTLAVERLRRCEPRDDSDLGLTLERLASALHQDGRSEESLAFWKEALETTQTALGATNSRTQRVRTRYAEVLRRCGHAAEAEALEALHK
jgi:tetratricopeptide (TPR) repeat protein